MEFLLRIKADPIAHLGRESLLALIGYYLETFWSRAKPLRARLGSEVLQRPVGRPGV
jgi:hypothetical protein